MSIAMDRYNNNEQMPDDRVSSGWPGLLLPYRMQCRSCGFEPTDILTPPPFCPKCASSAWELFVSPGSLLTNNDNYAEKISAKRASSAIPGAV
jgi:hypothetical protein